MIIKKTKVLKIFNFLIKEYHINEQLKSLKRKKVKKIHVQGETIAKMLFMCMFTREKSFNQLIEKIHKRKKYKNIFKKNEQIPKMHVFRDGIKELDLEAIKKINKNIIIKAKENKIYRKGTIDNLVVVGIDVIVGDAIYLEEKFLKEVKEEGYNAVIRLKENRKSFINEAEGLFKLQKAKNFKIKNRNIERWTEILNYKEIKVKVAKFKERYKKGKEIKEDTIYVVSTDVTIKEETMNKIIHERWDIENEGFNELKNSWNMKHCYMAEDTAIDIILQMIIMSYNLWELYIYGNIHNFENKKMTKIGYIENIVEEINKAKYREIEFSSA